jgi:phosphoribosylaminoimidazole-succinocarboxamide synthase
MRDNLISGLPLFKRGKVRDIYEVGDCLLMVASDRISCFDVVLPTKIPGKGKIITALSAYWFQAMTDIAPHHLLTTGVERFSSLCQAHLGLRRLLPQSLPL